jgi:ribosome-associated protein
MLEQRFRRVKPSEPVDIPAAELDFSYARSGGPGGQNVNKVASKAVMRWPMEASAAVPDYVKARLRKLFPSRVTAEGDVLIASQEFRDQERNRQACVEKLTAMLTQASTLPKLRRPTKPTKGSQKRRLNDKKKNAETKASRKEPGRE